MPELTPEQIFSLHPKIRWAGLATDKGEVVFAQMRPGIQSHSPEDADESFMQLGPLLLTGVCERLAPWAGSLETVASVYEKVVLLVTKLERRYLALTVNREDAGILSEVTPKLRELAARKG